MTTITLTLPQARYLVDVALSASSTDDVTPIICGAHITMEDGKLRVVCTDRYRAHTALVEAESIEGDVEVIIPRQALLWLRSNRTYFGSYMKDQQRVVIEATPHPEAQVFPGDLVVTVKESEGGYAGRVVWQGKHLKGNYPPVIRLIEKARDAEAVLATPRLNLTLLGRMSALARELPDTPWVKFTANENPNKPGSVYVSWRGSINDALYAEALIQPNLDRS